MPEHWQPQSLYLRVLLATIAGITIVLAAVTGLNLRDSRSRLIQELQNDGLNQINIISHGTSVYLAQRDEQQLREIGRAATEGGRIQFIAFYSPSNDLLITVAAPSAPDQARISFDSLPLQAQANGDNVVRWSNDYLEIAGSIDYQGQRVGVLALRLGTAGLEDDLNRELIRSIITALSLAIVLSLTVGLLLRQFVIVPLRRLSDASEQIRAGAWVMPPGQNRSDELGLLARSFGQMVSTVQAREIQLQEQVTATQALNTELDARVIERTADLQLANHSLLVAKEAAEAANRAKSRFLASMSHELRTPLNAILGYAQILKRQHFEPDLLSGLDTIQSSGEHLLTLINDILDLAKIEAGKLELVPAKIQLPSFLQTITDIIRVRAVKKQLNFTYQARTPLPEGVLADATRLRQVLLNLLDNAVKFTDAGQITFRVSVVGGSSSLLSGTPATQTAPATEHGPGSTGTICFEVEDTGSGIPPAQIDTIFAPFEQGGDLARRTAGTGLGLAISRQLVQLMGSELRVESKMGYGSRFSFTLMLPITAGATEPGAPSDQIITGYHGRRRRVLVVDDSPSNQAVLLHMLRPLGFELVEAADGGQAIALALETPLDLILMDLRMAGIDGFAAAQQLRQLSAMQGIPLIAVSASVADEEQAHSREMGFDAFLPKPIHWPRLVALLQEQLQLEWVYAEAEGATGAAPEVAGPLVSPPPDQLARLYRLVRLGNFYALRECAAHLETLDPSLIPFARKLRELVQGYHEQAILALLEPYLGPEVGHDNEPGVPRGRG